VIGGLAAIINVLRSTGVLSVEVNNIVDVRIKNEIRFML